MESYHQIYVCTCFGCWTLIECNVALSLIIRKLIRPTICVVVAVARFVSRLAPRPNDFSTLSTNGPRTKSLRTDKYSGVGVTRTFPWRLIVDKPCKVPRARLITCCCGFVVSAFNGDFCLTAALLTLRRTVVFFVTNDWPLFCLVVDALDTATGITFCVFDLAATEHSFDWSVSTQSVRALSSLTSSLLLRPSSWLLFFFLGENGLNWNHTRQ